ncbi:GntP family permease [uncultured Clostridium sp.]|uniref:GntP family permease n=1 Tax=uncultured Clostridium sp. TaxID=59620 RepID=UPI0025D6C415|nr:GntP family permease [uncultured Clostridium sp.]
MFDIVALLFSLALIMILAYKGHSTIVIAPIVALITILLTSRNNFHLMYNYTEVYMAGFSGFVKSYFPLFLTGAVFAKFMEETGYAKSIADFISQKLGAKHAILSIVLAGAFLTYGGVSLFVVAFILYPIAAQLFKEADIPKRLIPGTIALGAFTFTMTAMPGSPEIQNLIPMSYFGTDSFAAPLLGVLASFLMFSLGMIYLTYRRKAALKRGEGYVDCNSYTVQKSMESPNIFISIMPILVVFCSNLFFSKIYYTNINGDYLKEYGLTLNKVSGTWSVIIALVLGTLFMFILNIRKFKSPKRILDEAIKNSFVPLLNSSAIVGYGSVIKSLSVFAVLQNIILGISSNPIISEAISVNVICGLTASASGGLGITLDALSKTYIQMSNAMGIPPEVLHRVASLSCGGLDTLPHNGAVITTLAICGLTHKESYKDIFVTSVLIPIFTTIIVVLIVYLKFI